MCKTFPYNTIRCHYTRKICFCIERRLFSMRFHIQLTSFEQIKTFVSLAARQPFDVVVGNERQAINGKDLMGMFSLDYRFPLKVSVTCSQKEYEAFLVETKNTLKTA